MFTNGKITLLENRELLRRMTMATYTDYCQTPITTSKMEGSLQLDIALVIRTKDKVLCHFVACDKLNDKFVEALDIRCYLEGRDPNHYQNTYPNIISRIADHLMERYKIPQLSIVRNTILEPLGLLRIDDVAYLPFELFVSDTNLINLPSDLWVNIEELKNDFQNNNVLDTIIVENLKTV